MVKSSPVDQNSDVAPAKCSKHLNKNFLISAGKYNQDEAENDNSSNDENPPEELDSWKPKFFNMNVDHEERYNNTIVGCLINFMRSGPKSIEILVEHVKPKVHILRNESNKPYKKNALELVDYALTTKPKIFLLNDRFHYYLNETNANAYEKLHKHVKSHDKKRMNQSEISEFCKIKRKRHKEIETKIKRKIKTKDESTAILIKTYEMLTSDMKMLAAEVKFRINDLHRKKK